METPNQNIKTSDTKQVTYAAAQRSLAAQKKLDQANEDLAKLSQQDIDLLFARNKQQE